MTARQRNNITRLPQPVRFLICGLLDDGVTYEVIRSHPEVVKACAERKLALHNGSFGAYRASAEFDEYRKATRKYGEDIERRRMAAYLVGSEGGADAIANAATFELLRIVMNKVEAGGDLDPKELSSISGALAAYNRNRIVQDKEDSKREFAAKEAEYQAKIAELSAKITELAAKVGPANAAATIEEMDKFVRGDS